MTFIGVNGVGKSTNLSKVCFWLLQNKLRVLIAACDTFRSGAVEQLRVHVRNLGLLGQELGRGPNEGTELPRVELYERGYGKDAAGIAKDAIVYGEDRTSLRAYACKLTLPFLAAKEHQFDVVLVDTAGRMQDNEPLMRALAKVSAAPVRLTLLPTVNPASWCVTACRCQLARQDHLCWRSARRQRSR
jgi:signal recognition particle receptor subunit alpha